MDNKVTKSWSPHHKKETKQKADNTSLYNLKWNLTFYGRKWQSCVDNRVIVSKLFWLEILCDFQLPELHAYCVKSWDKWDAIWYSTTHPKTVTEQYYGSSVVWYTRSIIMGEKIKQKSSCSQSPVQGYILLIYYEILKRMPIEVNTYLKKSQWKKYE